MAQNIRMLRCAAGFLVALMLTVLPAVGAQSYPGAGLVLKINPEHNEVVVSMQEIPGYMDAMS